MDQIFEPGELKEITRPILDQLLEAIEKGDKEKAKALAKTMREDSLVWHTASINWVPALLSHMGRKYGETAVYEALMDTGENVIMRPFVEKTESMLKMSIKEKILWWAQIWRCHIPGENRGKFTIEEEDEKFIFKHDPCGGGGLLRRLGAYGPPKNFLIMKEPNRFTLNLSGFPVYCTHCIIYHEYLPIKWTGYPMFVQFPGKTPEDMCIHYHYKDPKTIPAEYYERLGLRKQT